MSLQQVNEEISSLTIEVRNLESHRRHDYVMERFPEHSNPVASLFIPNKLFLLWVQKLSLECQKCAGSLTCVALANANIQGIGIKLCQVKPLEVRLSQKKSAVKKQYSRLRHNKAVKFYNETMHMLLFEGETTPTVVPSAIHNSIVGLGGTVAAASSTGLSEIRGKYSCHFECTFKTDKCTY